MSSMLYIYDFTEILYAVKPIFGWLQHLNMNAAPITKHNSEIQKFPWKLF